MAPKTKRNKNQGDDAAPPATRARGAGARAGSAGAAATCPLLEDLTPELLRTITLLAMGDPQTDPWALPCMRVADTAGLAGASRALRAFVVGVWEDELAAAFDQPPPVADADAAQV